MRFINALVLFRDFELVDSEAARPRSVKLWLLLSFFYYCGTLSRKSMCATHVDQDRANDAAVSRILCMALTVIMSHCGRATFGRYSSGHMGRKGMLLARFRVALAAHHRLQNLLRGAIGNNAIRSTVESTADAPPVREQFDTTLVFEAPAKLDTVGVAASMATARESRIVRWVLRDSAARIMQEEIRHYARARLKTKLQAQTQAQAAAQLENAMANDNCCNDLNRDDNTFPGAGSTIGGTTSASLSTTPGRIRGTAHGTAISGSGGGSGGGGDGGGSDGNGGNCGRSISNGSRSAQRGRSAKNQKRRRPGTAASFSDSRTKTEEANSSTMPTSCLSPPPSTATSTTPTLGRETPEITSAPSSGPPSVISVMCPWSGNGGEGGGMGGFSSSDKIDFTPGRSLWSAWHGGDQALKRKSNAAEVSRRRSSSGNEIGGEEENGVFDAGGERFLLPSEGRKKRLSGGI